VPHAVFRLPRLAYLAVLFLFFCVAPLAFTATADEGAQAVAGPRLLLLLVPVGAAFFIARTSTVVDGSGIAVRALLGRRRLSWNDVRGVVVDNNSVYAVLADGGAVRMPCVRVGDLAAVSRASGGRLPEIADPVAKYPPSRRRRG
jgi:hypothetical protein